MKNLILYHILFLCCSVFSQSDSIKVRLKDYHSSEITQIKLTKNRKHIITGDASGKIILSDSKNYTYQKTLVEPNGIAIKKIRLFRSDSIVLYTQSYQLKDKKVDSLYGLDYNYKLYKKKELQGDLFVEHQEDVKIFYLKNNLGKRAIIIFDELLQPMKSFEIQPSVGIDFEVEKAFYIQARKQLLLYERRYDKKRLSIFDTNRGTLQKSAEFKDDYEVLHFFQDSKDELKAIVNNRTTRQLYLCDLESNFDIKIPSKVISDSYSILSYSINISDFKTKDDYLISICGKSSFFNPIVLSEKNNFKPHIVNSKTPTGFTTSYFIDETTIIFTNNISKGAENSSDFHNYNLKENKLRTIIPEAKGDFFRAHFFDDDSWVTYGVNKKFSTSIKYFPAGTFNNRFDIFDLKNYLEIRFGIKLRSTHIEIKKATQNICFQAWSSTKERIPKIFKYNLKEDKIQTVFPKTNGKISKEEDYLSLSAIIDFNDTSDKVLMSRRKYYNRGHTDPQEFFLISNENIKKLKGKYKFGRCSENGKYLVTINDKDVIEIFETPSFKKIFTKQLQPGSYKIDNRDNFFYITNSFSTIDFDKCNTETILLEILENDTVNYKVLDCLLFKDMDMLGDIFISIIDGVGISRQTGSEEGNNLKEYPIFKFPLTEFPQNISLNSDGTKFMVSLNNGKIQVYDFESLEKLSESVHPNIKTHVFVDNKGHFFSNIDPKKFLVVESNGKFNVNFSKIDSKLFRPDEILKNYGTPNEAYLQAVTKAVNLRQQYKSISFKSLKPKENKIEKKPNLYLFTIGVSDYLDSDYNLTYADKDALDIIDIYADSDSKATQVLQHKFLSHRYSIFNENNGKRSKLGCINKYQGIYGGVFNCKPLDSKGAKWLESEYGKDYHLWDFDNKKVQSLKFKNEIDERFIFINPNSTNSFFYVGEKEEKLYEYSFSDFSAKVIDIAFDINDWSSFYKNIRPIENNRWLYLKNMSAGLENNIALYRSELSNINNKELVLINLDKYLNNISDNRVIKRHSFNAELKAVSKNGNHILYTASVVAKDVKRALFYLEYNSNAIPVRLNITPESLDVFSISEDGQTVMRYSNDQNKEVCKYDISEASFTKHSYKDVKGLSILNTDLNTFREEQPIVDELMSKYKKPNNTPVSFDKIFVKYLINEEATNSNIKKGISSFFSGVTANDQIMLFISGHGVLSGNKEYLYAPYNMDFSNIESSGVTLNEILEILNKTKTQKKLLLMDTCHSGKTFDIKNNNLLEGSESEKNSKGKISKSLKKTTFKLSDVLSLFDNFYSKSGVSIISASAGTDVAYENDTLQNGAFTAALLKTIKDHQNSMEFYKKRDITLSDDFIEKLFKNVMILTNNKQLPDVKELNTGTDIKIW